MKSFEKGQRVLVKTVYRGVDLEGDAVGGTHLNPPAAGTVERVRRDGGAWVALDVLNEQRVRDGVHPFPAGDPRERHVLTYPEDCDPHEGERQEFDGDVIWRWRPPQPALGRIRHAHHAVEYVVTRQPLADHGVMVYAVYDDGRALANDHTAGRPIIAELLQRLHRVAQQALDARMVALTVRPAGPREPVQADVLVSRECLRCRKKELVGNATGHCDECAQAALAELATLTRFLGSTVLPTPADVKDWPLANDGGAR